MNYFKYSNNSEIIIVFAHFSVRYLKKKCFDLILLSPVHLKEPCDQTKSNAYLKGTCIPQFVIFSIVNRQ